MRIPIIAAFAVLWSAAAWAANDQPWCYRDFSGPQFTNCSFPTIRHCLAIAGIMGGVCERNQPEAASPPPKPQKRRR